jgi:hypothetical protein
LAASVLLDNGRMETRLADLPLLNPREHLELHIQGRRRAVNPWISSTFLPLIIIVAVFREIAEMRCSRKHSLHVGGHPVLFP